MFFGGGFGVGLTVADLAPAAVGPPVVGSPVLAEVLPVYARTAAEKAAELRRVQRLKAELAAYEVELVAAFAADRPDTLDRPPGRPGAAAGTGDDSRPGPGAPAGVSEFFADELALVLTCSRTAASVLAEHASTLTGTLRATLAALAQGRLNWSRARTIAEELGNRVRGTHPGVLAAVQAAVLPEAAGLSIRRLRDRLRAELVARDAAAGAPTTRPLPGGRRPAPRRAHRDGCRAPSSRAPRPWCGPARGPAGPARARSGWRAASG